MKKSHRKDVIIARVIFAAICLILIAAIAAIVVLVHGHNVKNQQGDTMSQQTQGGNIPPATMDPNLPPVTENAGTETDYTQYLWTNTGVNMRTEPNTDCEVITILEAYTQVELLGEEDGWVKVSYNGQEGYVCIDFITYENPTEAE